MTDTTTLDETPDAEELPELVESERLGADGTAKDTPLKTRVLLPLLVPLFSIAIVAVLVLNISRVFLAGNKDAALALGIIITLAILVGASLIAAAPRLSTASLVVILAGVFVLVSMAGLVSLGPSLNDSEGGATGFQYATGPAKGTCRRRGRGVDQLQRHRVHRAGRGRPVQLPRRHRPHPGHPGSEVRRLPAHHRRRGPKSGKVDLTPGKYTHLLHRPRATRPRG